MQPTNRMGFSQLPGVVKAALCLVLVAWTAFFVTHVALYGTLSIIHMAFAGLFCMLVLSYKNVGRILCAVYHLIMAGVLIHHVLAGDQYAIYQGFCAFLFVLSAILLLLPQTARFFKNPSFRPKE